MRIIFRNMFFLLFFLLLSNSLYSKTDSLSGEGAFSVLALEDGVKIIYNSDGSSFQFDVKCSSFKPIEAENMLFLVDSLIFQITPVPLKEILGRESDNMNDSLALIYHFAYEVRNIRNYISGYYKINNEFITGDNSRLINIWSFKMPNVNEDSTDKKSKRIVMQMYATTRAGDKIVVLSSALVKENNPELVKKLFVGTFNTLKVSDKKIDVEKIRKKLQKETGKGKQN